MLSNSIPKLENLVKFECTWCIDPTDKLLMIKVFETVIYDERERVKNLIEKRKKEGLTTTPSTISKFESMQRRLEEISRKIENIPECK